MLRCEKPLPTQQVYPIVKASPVQADSWPGKGNFQCNKGILLSCQAYWPLIWHQMWSTWPNDSIISCLIWIIPVDYERSWPDIFSFLRQYIQMNYLLAFLWQRLDLLSYGPCILFQFKIYILWEDVTLFTQINLTLRTTRQVTVNTHVFLIMVTKLYQHTVN